MFLIVRIKSVNNTLLEVHNSYSLFLMCLLVKETCTFGFMQQMRAFKNQTH